MTWVCEPCAERCDVSFRDGAMMAAQGWCSAGGHRSADRIEWHEDVASATYAAPTSVVAEPEPEQAELFS
jgi:hypothetical protein